MRFILLFIVVLPVIDLAFFGHFFGFWNTVFLVLGTAVVGFAMIRYQGLKALADGREKWLQGQLPLSELATGVFLLVAGMLFIHPGVVTDMVGLMCLIPGVRQLLTGYLLSRGFTLMQQRGFVAPNQPSSGADGDIIEGNFERDSDESRRQIER